MNTLLTDLMFMAPRLILEVSEDNRREYFLAVSCKLVIAT
jgi:hypothetical protein